MYTSCGVPNNRVQGLRSPRVRYVCDRRCRAKPPWYGDEVNCCMLWPVCFVGILVLMMKHAKCPP